MKTRAKNERVSVDNRFQRFPDFLKHMGPKPDRTHTLDRIVRTGPYTLENVRWADKTTQANNRRNTRYVLYNGEMRPAMEVARLTGQVPDTVRKRAARAGTYAKPKRPAKWRRSASTAPVPSELPLDRYLPDRFRWVHEDDREVSFWLGLYQFGEEDETGTWQLVEQVRASDGGTRRETFREFMERMDRALVYALTTGDVGGLPSVLSDKIAAYDETQRENVLLVSNDRLNRMHEEWMREQFAGDPLVTDQENLSCDISWMTKSREEVDFMYVMQQVQSRFERSKRELPPILCRLVQEQSKQLLGRRTISRYD